MNDWFREFLELQTKDPQAFYLMIGCISLLVFLSLTIFGGFIWYLYRGDKSVPKTRNPTDNSSNIGSGWQFLKSRVALCIDTAHNIDIRSRSFHMAESVKQLNLLGDTLNLDGLEPLLERAHMEVVPVGKVSDEVSETRLILDLMTQVELVNELVMETSFKLQRAHETLLQMEKESFDQELRLERMKDLDAKVVELETWLEAAVAENTLLKRPWYKKIFNWRY